MRSCYFKKKKKVAAIASVRRLGIYGSGCDELALSPVWHRSMCGLVQKDSVQPVSAADHQTE